MSINLITKYVPLLDEVYKRGLTSSDLEGNSALVRESMDANSVLVPRVSNQGLADYDKSTGFVAGSSSLTWETHTFTQDRGRSFTIDNADNMETAGLAFGTLGADFVSVNVVPETDAYRYATLAAKAAIQEDADLTSATVDAAIDAGSQSMDEANVPTEGRILYVSPSVYTLIKQSDNFDRSLAPGQSPNRNFGTYDDMKVVKVPQSRFYSKITLYDGTTGGQEAGGYVKTAVTGFDLNFLIVHPSAVIPITKINKTRVFSPGGENGLPVNPDADAWKFQQRVYHDCFVLENKVTGVYAHTKEQG